MDSGVNNEVIIRVACFSVVLLALLLGEWLSPKRKRDATTRFRQGHNILLFVAGALVVRALFPAAAVGVALYADAKGWGLMNAAFALQLPQAVWVVLGFVVLDFSIWCQHYCFHKVPLLWRLHRVHHSDVAFDVTTALRFHPVEIILSMMIKSVIIVLLGVPVLSVLVFEVVLNGVSMFNHGNIQLPAKLDRFLRLWLVTPDMHRVHHSWHRDETDSNFGFNLPWWDRLFRTYCAQPRDGHNGMKLGLKRFREKADTRIDRLLTQPLMRVDSHGEGGVR